MVCMEKTSIDTSESKVISRRLTHRPHLMNKPRSVLLFLILFLQIDILITHQAYAQIPVINGMAYAGVLRGGAASIVIDGKDLLHVHALLSGAGITIVDVVPTQKGDYAEIKLQIDKAAALTIILPFEYVIA